MGGSRGGGGGGQGVWTPPTNPGNHEFFGILIKFNTGEYNCCSMEVRTTYCEIRCSMTKKSGPALTE